MKKGSRWMALLLGIMMTISIMPFSSYAEMIYDDSNVPTYSAEFYGNPEIWVYEDWGKAEILDADDSEYIIVHKPDGDLRVHIDYDDDYNMIVEDDENDDLDYILYVEDSKPYMEIWASGEYLPEYEMYEPLWYAEVKFTTFVVDSPVSKIVFQPNGGTKLYSEDIKGKDNDGKDIFDFSKRGNHAFNGEHWQSEFVPGDKFIVYDNDGRYKEYVNTDMEDPSEDADYLYNDYFKCGDETLYVDAIVDGDGYWRALKAGNNKIIIDYYGRRTSFNVYVETPESRAAAAKAKAEAEAKAKAEAEAKAKAAALAAASNINKATVSASDIKAASNLGATSVTLGAKVKKIKKNAFKGTNITTVEVKTKKLKAKSVKGSLKGSKVKTIKVNIGKAKVNKKFKKAYKKIFTKKNAGKKASVK